MGFATSDRPRGEVTTRLADYDRSRAGITAVHEAGHAAALFLLGRGWDIRHVSTVPDDVLRGHIRYRGDDRAFDWMRWDGDDRRRVVNATVLHQVAGLAAENRHAAEAERSCLGFVVSDEVDGCFDSPEACGCDGHSALRTLLDDGETERVAGRRLFRVCEWAEELFDIPRVWGVVTALADRLPFGTVLPGKEASRIMFAAWGADRVTVGQLGRQWSRRFQSTAASIVRPVPFA